MKTAVIACGVVFGFTLGAARLFEYDVIHRMLLLQEFDVYFLMASAVGTAMPLLWLLERRRWNTTFGGPLVVQRAPVTTASVAGSAVFGAGWAIAGSCPGPAVVMLSSGRLAGVAVFLGLLLGARLRDAVSAGKQANDVPAPAEYPAMG